MPLAVRWPAACFCCFHSVQRCDFSCQNELARNSDIELGFKWWRFTELQSLNLVMMFNIRKISHGMNICDYTVELVALSNDMFEVFTRIKVSTVNLFVTFFCRHEDGYRRCREFMPCKTVQQIPPYLSLPPKGLHRVKTQKTKPKISIAQLLKDLRWLIQMHIKNNPTNSFTYFGNKRKCSSFFRPDA
jgi:hypothetical protein